ncbi:hypothetical protein RchiOBHm_Chr5g0031221 [Rosa chinensis]|uniref:Uncharacterized protein n=1 Tax=Rosa chinensis TaxID=74649 RepID=A0A2P6QA39_ROSCH|nr:hypothetical protein RchiOBHm_Chr5g0031221 [Rosa chinensis]
MDTPLQSSRRRCSLKSLYLSLTGITSLFNPLASLSLSSSINITIPGIGVMQLIEYIYGKFGNWGLILQHFFFFQILAQGNSFLGLCFCS